MLKTILFDLDGTLLPMDQNLFVKTYLDAMGRKMASYGYDPDRLLNSIWRGTEAVMKNESTLSNEDIFWTICSDTYGHDIRIDEPIFRLFYEKEFQEIRNVCGYNAQAAETISILKQKGYRLILATNPLFPAVATYSRIRWAGLVPEDFELVTTYENSRRCKPNSAYFRDILDKLNLNPEECLMVGNDTEEDMIAETTGMHVFLLTDCMINRKQVDIDRYPKGSFSELLQYIERYSI